jgi:hypothetical protein
MVNLTTTEKNILEAPADKPLTVERLAPKAGYEVIIYLLQYDEQELSQPPNRHMLLEIRFLEGLTYVIPERLNNEKFYAFC